MRSRVATTRLLTILVLTGLLSSACALFPRPADPTPVPAVPTAQPTLLPTVALVTRPTAEPTLTVAPNYGPPFTPAPPYGPPFATPVASTVTVTEGTATSSQPPSEEEAEAVVEAYFAAIEADSYDAARALTTGTATGQTDTGAEQIRRESTAEGVTVDLRVPELTTDALPPEPESTAVQTDYVVEAWVDTGLFGDVKAREGRGSTLFHTVRTSTGAKIERIEGGLFPPSE